MQLATAKAIKDELQHLPKAELLAICHRLVRYKVVNKELVNFLLFYSHDIPAFVADAKMSISELMAKVNVKNGFFAKKGIRKALNSTLKYAKLAGENDAEVALLLHFLEEFKLLPNNVKQLPVIFNMEARQLAKVRVLIAALHPDLQHDYARQLDAL